MTNVCNSCDAQTTSMHLRRAWAMLTATLTGMSYFYILFCEWRPPLHSPPFIMHGEIITFRSCILPPISEASCIVEDQDSMCLRCTGLILSTVSVQTLRSHNRGEYSVGAAS